MNISRRIINVETIVTTKDSKMKKRLKLKAEIIETGLSIKLEHNVLILLYYIIDTT